MLNSLPQFKHKGIEMEEPESPGGLSLREMVDQWTSQQPFGSGRRLSFLEQCAAFAALRAHFRQTVVREAFGLSSASVSYLNTCHEPKRPGKRVYYAEVAKEYASLGDAAFFARYFNREWWDKLTRIKHDVAEPGDKAGRGPNPAATHMSFRLKGVLYMRDETDGWRIDWTEGAAHYRPHPETAGLWLLGNLNTRSGFGGPGWRFIDCKDKGEISDGPEFFYQGFECHSPTDKGRTREIEPKPFRTSNEAFNNLKKYLGVTK